ncbi:MAG: hypothetical protein ACRERR_14005 [Moraxellaceae bacterium]
MFRYQNAPEVSTASAPRKKQLDQSELVRRSSEDNLQWLQRALDKLKPASEETALLLLGGDDRLSRRLRQAQARMRNDLAPSWWSHALCLPQAQVLSADSELWEISLNPQQGFGFPALANGIQQGRLGHYRERTVSADANLNSYPNIALLMVPVAGDKVAEAIAQLQKQRLQQDFPALVLRWLAWAWGTGAQDNPLLEGLGLPSAVMLEAAFAAADYDLTPGLESRSCCPEAIWQAARWWQDYQRARPDGKPSIRSRYCAPHNL